MSTEEKIAELKKLRSELPDPLGIYPLPSGKKFLVVDPGNLASGGSDYGFVAECDDVDYATALVGLANNAITIIDELQDFHRQVMLDCSDAHTRVVGKKNEEIAQLKVENDALKIMARNLVYKCHTGRA